MIGLGIHGWSRVASSAKVHLVAPEGTACGVITIRERSRLRSFEELVSGKRPLAEQRWVSGPSYILNSEGEQGGLATIRASTPTGEVQRDVGAFVGDGFCASIVGTTSAPHYFERTTRLVRELAKRMKLWLGVRRRLVLYPAPRGWHGVRQDLDAHWCAPSFPRDPTIIVVFPAVPANGAIASEVLDALQSQYVRDSWDDAVRHTPQGLDVHVRSATSLRIAVAVDGRYIYSARIEHANAEHLAVFDTILDGLHPVPSVAISSSAVEHWID